MAFVHVWPLLVVDGLLMLVGQKGASAYRPKNLIVRHLHVTHSALKEAVGFFASCRLSTKGCSGHELPALRVGFTASRKVGNAVKRNFARRRLKAVVETVCSSFSIEGKDLVIIARPTTVTAPFANILRDFHQALYRLELTSL